ncbi:MAG: amine oxidase [Ginsengibacter sp.]
MYQKLHSPFKSFWIGGFECADHLNAFGNRVDLLRRTGHIQMIDKDYKNLAMFGIQTVREGIRWSKVERKPYSYDWSVVIKMMHAAKIYGIQQVWDICHFGFADDLFPFHPKFANRFAELCKSFVLLAKELYPDDQLIITPINEVSFLSWLGGDAVGTTPYCTNKGWDVKYALMRAYIEGVHAMKAIDPDIKILSTEPIVQIVPPLEPTEQEVQQALLEESYQYQCTDILCGNFCPELGGNDNCLDMIGVNFYYNNRWVLGYHNYLDWVKNDTRWQPLSQMLVNVFNRYQKPLIISETSHPGEDRPAWIKYIGDECIDSIRLGLPLWGVCIYPIIDRPDWDFEDRDWHRSGLWDNYTNTDTSLDRVLNEDYAAAFRDTQKLIAAELAQGQHLLNYSPNLQDEVFNR